MSIIAKYPQTDDVRKMVRLRFTDMRKIREKIVNLLKNETFFLNTTIDDTELIMNTCIRAQNVDMDLFKKNLKALGFLEQRNDGFVCVFALPPKGYMMSVYSFNHEDFFDVKICQNPNLSEDELWALVGGVNIADSSSRRKIFNDYIDSSLKKFTITNRNDKPFSTQPIENIRTEKEKIKMPIWLKANIVELKNQFNLKNILHDSLYYPSAGTDVDPIRYFTGNTYSFVYVDYDTSKTTSDAEINEKIKALGYKRLFKFDVSETYFVHDIDNYYKNQNYYLDAEDKRMGCRNHPKKPYCYWAVFERLMNGDAEDNPKRFSLLYLCSEAVSAYEVLYAMNRMAPKIFCIIMPGHACGGNWTNYYDRNLPMAQKVLSEDWPFNPWPEYLVNGGPGDIANNYAAPIWPEYRKEILRIEKGEQGGRSFIVWANTYR